MSVKTDYEKKGDERLRYSYVPIVDEEFERLIPPLSEEEFSQLEQNILEEGECHDPIITWNQIIVDGHNRWRIIQSHPGEIDYKCVEKVFLSRNDAMTWIINNQLGRRNLKKVDAILLAQKRCEIVAAEAKERQLSTLKQNADRFVNNDKTEESPIDTRKEVAKLAGVSTGTVAQFEQIQKKAPELIPKIQAQEMTIGGAYKAVKAAEKADALLPTTPEDEEDEYTAENLGKDLSDIFDTCLDMIHQLIDSHQDVATDNPKVVLSAIRSFVKELTTVKERVE